MVYLTEAFTDQWTDCAFAVIRTQLPTRGLRWDVLQDCVRGDSGSLCNSARETMQ